MMRLALLGSTGSIGTQTLEVVRSLQDNGIPVEISVLAAKSNIQLLEQQIRAFCPRASGRKRAQGPYP